MAPKAAIEQPCLLPLCTASPTTTATVHCCYQDRVDRKEKWVGRRKKGCLTLLPLKDLYHSIQAEHSYRLWRQNKTWRFHCSSLTLAHPLLLTTHRGWDSEIRGAPASTVRRSIPPHTNHLPRMNLTHAAPKPSLAMPGTARQFVMQKAQQKPSLTTNI